MAFWPKTFEKIVEMWDTLMQSGVNIDIFLWPEQNVALQTAAGLLKFIDVSLFYKIHEALMC